MSRPKLSFTLTLLCTALAVGAPEPATAQSPTDCACLADLDTLAASIERNYIAFRFEVAGRPREAAYRNHLAALRSRAVAVPDTGCVHLLRELTGWFRDGHLFLIQFPPSRPADEIARAAAVAERLPVDESALRRDLSARRGRDPIEGIWYAPGFRLAVVPDRARSGAFVAVVLHSDSAPWASGHIKARLVRQPDSSYRTVLWAGDWSRRDIDLRIYRGILAAGYGITWGKAFPLAVHETGTLDSIDPLRPTLRLAGSDAVVVSVPSHDPRFTAVLETLVTRHRADLLARPFLIVDLRGDLGGGSLTTAPLVPWLVSREMRPAIGPRGLSMVLSSPDNIRYFNRGWNPDSIAHRMAAAPGQVLPLLRTEGLSMPFPNDTVLPHPRRVGVLMDRGVASAGEAFVLQARRSTKVTLFGQPTYGMIDYQSVQIVRLACRASGHLLGYPMIAASPDLPRDGFNAAGIPPDVRLPVDTGDAVGTVLRRLRGMP